ncbi:hypothetical protein [Aeromicrobium sp. P5_D10]
MTEASADDLERAIRDRLLVEFTYDRQPRLVQPAALGPHRMTHNLSLRGYQVSGRSNSRRPPFWTMFAVNRIEDLLVTDTVFPADPPGYANGDRHIHPVTIEL